MSGERVSLWAVHKQGSYLPFWQHRCCLLRLLSCNAQVLKRLVFVSKLRECFCQGDKANSPKVQTSVYILRICVYRYGASNVSVYVGVHVCLPTCLRMCVWVCLYVCVCVCVCEHLHKKRRKIKENNKRRENNPAKCYNWFFGHVV